MEKQNKFNFHGFFFFFFHLVSVRVGRFTGIKKKHYRAIVGLAIYSRHRLQLNRNNQS